MRIFVLLLGLLLVADVTAATSSALGTLKAGKESVNIKQVKNVTDNTVINRIEICPTNVCDRFEVRGKNNLSRLADYVLLYSVYIKKYPDFSIKHKDQDIPEMSFITQAIKDGTARHILEGYVKVYKCPEGRAQAVCAIKQLGVKLPVSLFTVTYDEGVDVVPSAPQYND